MLAHAQEHTPNTPNTPLATHATHATHATRLAKVLKFFEFEARLWPRLVAAAAAAWPRLLASRLVVELLLRLASRLACFSFEPGRTT